MISLIETSNKWKHLLKEGERKFFKKKTVIYHQGTAGNGFYYLHSGLVKITTSTSAGNHRMLNIVIPGQLVGVQAMDQQTHFTTAVTAADSVLYFFPYEKFHDLMQVQPEIVSLISQTLIEKMNILLHAIHIKSLTAEAQIAMILLNLFDECKNYEIPLSQQELAHYTGLTRITVYKILKQWKESGYIEIKSRAFHIKRLDMLHHIVREPSI